VLRSLAFLGAALIVHAVWRAWRLRRRTRQTLKQWMASAEPVTLPGIDLPIFAVHSAFPIIAVVGLVRQRIVIARSVLDACAPEEVRAILAHEQVHIDRHDNVRRAIFAASPDVLSWLPVSGRLLAAWHDRCEENADNGASRLGERGRVLLAQALIRVARLAPATPSIQDLPASALYRGEELNRRIHRLLAPPAAVAAPSLRLRYLIALAFTASVPAVRPIHDLVEAAVTWLP
jgi:beta-lactamase regulating signal transducer with metallopeptidase domain